MGEHGWPFAKADEFPGANEDTLYGSSYVKDLYLRAKEDYTGRYVALLYLHRFERWLITKHRFTVPILWDKKNQTIVNNESSEIIRIFNTAFNELIPADKAALDFYPTELRSEIDGINEWVYDTVNSKLSAHLHL